MKELRLPDCLVKQVLKGDIRQIRGNQVWLREYSIGSEFELQNSNGDYQGTCIVKNYDSCKFLAITSYEYESNESFLDFINNYLKINGPVDILNTSIGILSFELVIDRDGNKVRFNRDKGAYEVSNNEGSGISFKR